MTGQSQGWGVRWAVAIAEPGRDFTAEQSLRREGYRVIFLVRRVLLTGHRGKWWTRSAFVSRPLFDGYGFVQLWPDQEWPESDRIAGFYGLLGGQSPVWLDEATVLDWYHRTLRGKFDDERPDRSTKKSEPTKFQPANSEEERQKVLGEFMAKIGGAQYAAAS